MVSLPSPARKAFSCFKMSHEPVGSQKMTTLISEFMRKAVKERDTELISLKDEISHIQRYTEIKKVRFGDQLFIDYHVDTATED